MHLLYSFALGLYKLYKIITLSMLFDDVADIIRGQILIFRYDIRDFSNQVPCRFSILVLANIRIPPNFFSPFGRKTAFKIALERALCSLIRAKFKWSFPTRNPPMVCVPPPSKFYKSSGNGFCWGEGFFISVVMGVSYDGHIMFHHQNRFSDGIGSFII